MRILALLLITIYTVAAAWANPDLDQIRDQMTGKTQPSTGPTTTILDPQAQAQKITESPLYIKSKPNQDSKSWLSDSLENFFERIGKFLEKLFDNRQAPNAPSAQLGPGIGQVIIAILIAILAGFLIFMLAQLRFGKKGKSESSETLISAEEARRTADQWISEADRLAAAGQFREAVRCLYLACLIRMDEQQILRFERHETNWEHLYRFRDLPHKPTGFDLDPVTRNFDAAWYGFVPQSQANVDEFKGAYTTLLQSIRSQPR
jgi:hypothetical protein